LRDVRAEYGYLSLTDPAGEYLTVKALREDKFLEEVFELSSSSSSTSILGG